VWFEALVELSNSQELLEIIPEAQRSGIRDPRFRNEVYNLKVTHAETCWSN
jgi:hypothetical protein